MKKQLRILSALSLVTVLGGASSISEEEKGSLGYHYEDDAAKQLDFLHTLNERLDSDGDGTPDKIAFDIKFDEMNPDSIQKLLQHLLNIKIGKGEKVGLTVRDLMVEVMGGEDSFNAAYQRLLKDARSQYIRKTIIPGMQQRNDHYLKLNSGVLRHLYAGLGFVTMALDLEHPSFYSDALDGFSQALALATDDYGSSNNTLDGLINSYKDRREILGLEAGLVFETVADKGATHYQIAEWRLRRVQKDKSSHSPKDDEQRVAYRHLIDATKCFWYLNSLLQETQDYAIFDEYLRYLPIPQAERPKEELALNELRQRYFSDGRTHFETLVRDQAFMKLSDAFNRAGVLPAELFLDGSDLRENVIDYLMKTHVPSKLDISTFITHYLTSAIPKSMRSD